MEPPPLASGDPSETARLVGSQSSRSSSSLRLKSLFAGSQDVFHNLPSENGRANISMVGLKMEPGVVPHCHLMPCSITQSQQKHQAQRKLSIACLVCFLFMVGEVIGGYLAHSLAIMTDAAHLLTDMGSMGVSLFSLWVSTRPATKTMSFGWHRSETLGALASVLSIWIVTGVLVYLASARIISNDYEIEASVMLGTSACAVGVNIIMAYLLHQSGSAHSHGFSTRGYEQIEESPHGPSIPTHDNTSVRAAFVHVVGDLLQSIGVFVAATVIYFKPQCKIADPVSTFLFSVFVLGSTLTILRDVFRVLMEATEFPWMTLEAGSTLQPGGGGLFCYPMSSSSIHPLICWDGTSLIFQGNYVEDTSLLLHLVASSQDLYVKWLLDGTPRGVEFQAVKETLLSVKGVKQVHNLHLWALTLSHHVVAVHVAVESDADMEVVLQEATALLQSKFGFFSCTIQVEHYLDDMATCHQCLDPQD